MTPYVTVLMAAYNAEKYISEAIVSILNQSFENFEFIIVDDGSKDATPQIINEFRSKDKRIKAIFNDSNVGQSESLNRGIEIAQGKYIARMDADDISLNHRLKTQFEFMENHPEIAVSSAWMEAFGTGEKTVRKSPATHQKIVTELFVRNCLWHPVAIIRKGVLNSLDLRYDSDYPKGQDYKLWTQFARFSELANIPEVLLQYRLHEEQKTKINLDTKPKKSSIQVTEKKGIHRELLSDFLSREPTENELTLHLKLFFQIPFSGKKELDRIRNWVDFLKSENYKIKKYIEPNFSNLLDEKFSQTKAKSFKYSTVNRKRFTPKILWELFFTDEKYYMSFSNRELIYMILNSFAMRKNRWYSGENL